MRCLRYSVPILFCSIPAVKLCHTTPIVCRRMDKSSMWMTIALGRKRAWRSTPSIRAQDADCIVTPIPIIQYGFLPANGASCSCLFSCALHSHRILILPRRPRLQILGASSLPHYFLSPVFDIVSGDQLHSSSQHLARSRDTSLLFSPDPFPAGDPTAIS